MARFVAAVALALALMLTGCATTIQGQPSASPELDWKPPIVDAVANLGSRLGPVGDAMIANDYPAMRTSCTDLLAAVDRLADQLPTPDVAVDDALERGVDNYRSFAKLCVALTPGSGGSELTRLNGYLDRGDAGVRRALTLMGVQIPPR